MAKRNEPLRTGIRFGSVGKGTFRKEHITARCRASSFVALAVLAAGTFLLSTAAPALADGERGPETVYFEVADVDRAEPVPAPRPWRPEVSEDDAEILARLLWSSPLTNETDKRRLCWVVFNRIDDEGPLFGMTVADVVIRREFTFFNHKAHLSETNLRIARDELARWTAMLMGIPVERPLPEGYVYAGFSGHSVRFYRQIGGEAWSGQ